MTDTTYTLTQVMMTLSALAPTGATERPSGETLEQQQQRILLGINTQLADATLATTGQWKAIWLGLTTDRANLAYIALCGATGELAVVLRGTFTGSPIDTAEDMDVGSVLPFTAGGGGNISAGAMEAFTEITGAVAYAYTSPIASATNLLGALYALAATKPPTIYVTGHSLGGALATTVSLYLVGKSWMPPIAVYTFAAPTAGDQAFAECFNNAKLESAVNIYNEYDVVPRAWQALLDVKKFFPFELLHQKEFPGPVAKEEVKLLIDKIAKKTGDIVYAQPNRESAYNTDYQVRDGNYVGGHRTATVADFEHQAAYQHANNTYLGLLNAPIVPDYTPTVTKIDPTSASETGGISITITGTNFFIAPGNELAPVGVDFGTVAATVTNVTSTSLTVTAPAVIGYVPVRVTTIYGTSPDDPSVLFSGTPVT
jgi:hypothetical protein